MSSKFKNRPKQKRGGTTSAADQHLFSSPAGIGLRKTTLEQRNSRQNTAVAESPASPPITDDQDHQPEPVLATKTIPLTTVEDDQTPAVKRKRTAYLEEDDAYDPTLDSLFSGEHNFAHEEEVSTEQENGLTNEAEELFERVKNSIQSAEQDRANCETLYSVENVGGDVLLASLRRIEAKQDIILRQNTEYGEIMLELIEIASKQQNPKKGRTRKKLCQDPLDVPWDPKTIEEYRLEDGGKILLLSDIGKGTKRDVFNFVVSKLQHKRVVIGAIDITAEVDLLLEAFVGRFEDPVKMFMATLMLCFDISRLRREFYFPPYGNKAKERKKDDQFGAVLPLLERKFFTQIFQRLGPGLIARRILGTNVDLQIGFLNSCLDSAKHRIRNMFVPGRGVSWTLPVDKNKFIPLFERNEIIDEMNSIQPCVIRSAFRRSNSRASGNSMEGTSSQENGKLAERAGREGGDEELDPLLDIETDG